MKKRCMVAGLLVLASAALLAGCGGAATPEATLLPVVADTSSGSVVAEAVIEPARSDTLSFEMGGTVIQVEVERVKVSSGMERMYRFSTSSSSVSGYLPWSA